MTFWNEQKLGANFFNQIPTEQWFIDAKKANIQWVCLTYCKWQSKHLDFLLGYADHFTQLAKDDLRMLKQVLSWAEKHKIPVVVTPLSLPGARWMQNNHNKKDLRLWTDKKYWNQAIRYWQQLAAELKGFNYIVGYNTINEPIPEMGSMLADGA